MTKTPWDKLLAAIAAKADESELEELRNDVRAWDGDVEWQLYEEGHGYDTVMAACAADALEIAKDNVDRANYPIDNDRDNPRGTIWIHVRVTCDEIGEEAEATVACDPDEPECGDGEAHDWQSDYSLLGGLEENPGVQGHGGGVIIERVCMRCGCARIMDTWAQNPENGEQGLESVCYEPGKYVEQLAEREGE